MPAGRPSKYQSAFVEQAFNLCLLGATNEDLARAFSATPQTIDAWFSAHPEFLDAIKRGREVADAKVASRLYSRACGYEHQAVKIVADAKTGAEHIVPYIERYPPDTVAAIFWLKNRRPDLWRDKREIEHTRKDDARSLTDDELSEIARDAKRGGEGAAGKAGGKAEPGTVH